MTGFHDLDPLKRLAVAVFDDEEARFDPRPQEPFQRQSHGRRGFPHPHDPDPAPGIQGPGSVTHQQAPAFRGKAPGHCILSIGSCEAGTENPPCVVT
jgi:hypothetical protein